MHFDTIDLNKHIIKHPASTFFVRVKNDSMKDKGIFEGDMLAINRSLNPKNGSIVIVQMNGAFSIKELKKSEHQIILKSANKKYPDIYIKHSDDFEIWGVVTNVIRTL